MIQKIIHRPRNSYCQCKVNEHHQVSTITATLSHLIFHMLFMIDKTFDISHYNSSVCDYYVVVMLLSMAEWYFEGCFHVVMVQTTKILIIKLIQKHEYA